MEEADEDQEAQATLQENEEGKEPEIFPIQEGELSQEEWVEFNHFNRGDDTQVWMELSNVHETRATIGVAVEDAWEQAQVELNFIRDKLERICGTRRPKMDQLIDYVVTSYTPKRNVQAKIEMLAGKLTQGRLDQMAKLFVQRTQKCPCFHVVRTGENEPNGPGGRGTCATCGTQTHDYCLGCHRWLCASLSDKASKLEGWKSQLLLVNSRSPSDDTIYCQETCMGQAHRGTQRTLLGALEEGLLVSPSSMATTIEHFDFE